MRIGRASCSRPAHGGSQCFARPSGRDRPHRAAGREHAYGLKRMAVDGFNENGEIVSPIVCAAHFVRLSAKLTRWMRLSERSQGACGVGQGERDGQAVDDIPASARSPHRRSWPRSRTPAPSRAGVSSLPPRPDTAPELDRRQNAARAHHKDGRPLPAQASGGGRLRDAGHAEAITTPASMGERDARAQDGQIQVQSDAVALANKVARIVFVLDEGGQYDDRPVAPERTRLFDREFSPPKAITSREPTK